MLPKQNRLKTFILQNQITQHSQVIILPINISQREIDLSQLLIKNVQNYQSCVFRIYDFSVNSYKNFHDLTNNQWHVPNQFINNGQAVVLIKYKNTLNEERSSIRDTFSESEDIKDVSDSSSLKKERAKERAISQVIQIVKHWRELHLQKRGQKRISLQQAAKIIGLPKKSLDDYYYQLRLGEKYNFDFRTHLYEGIGCLRNFLKNKKPRLKSEQSNESNRPKNLRIIEQYDQIKKMGMMSMSMDIQQQDVQQQHQNVQSSQIDRKQNKQKRHSYNYKKKNSINNNNNSKQQDMIFEQQQQQPIYNVNQQKQSQQKTNNCNNNDSNNSNNSMPLELYNDDSEQIKLQNQFYEDFEFMEFNQDPFINMDANFKKKKYENLFDQHELFF